MDDSVNIEDSVILIIDDSTTQCKIIQSMFKEYPFRLAFETSGEAGLGKAMRLLPNLILQDIELPGMSGFETLRILKTLDIVQHIPVIIMTGSSNSKHVARGFELGAVDFINKPFNAAEVQSRVKAQLMVQSLIQMQREQLLKAERLAELGDMVASFCHEISTPIGVSVTASSQLEKEITTLEQNYNNKSMRKTDLTRFFEIGLEASRISTTNLDRAGKLIASFKRVAVDQCSEDPDEIPIKEYLNQIIMSLRPKLKKTDHVIDIDCDGTIVIMGFPGAFSQVFINLIMNSVIHGFENMSSGTITIKVTCDEQKVHIQYTDNGKGLEQVSLQRIFDKYYTTKRGKGGSGLGMAIVKELIHNPMGGEIQVVSSPGNGVRFDIHLPMKVISKKNTDESNSSP